MSTKAKVTLVDNNPKVLTKVQQAIVDKYAALAQELADATGLEEWTLVIKVTSDGQSVLTLRSGTMGLGLDSLRIQRIFRDDEIIHHLLTLSPELQGRGLANIINRASVELADSLGIKKITLEANLDVGGYAWARKGFLPQVGRDPMGKVRIAASGNGKVYPELYDRLVAIVKPMNTDAELIDFFTGPDFPEFKDLFLGTHWAAEGDLSNAKFRRALLGEVVRRAPDPLPDAPGPLDIAIRRQVLIERFKQSQVDDFAKTLAEIDADIRARLSGDNITEFTRARLNAQLAELEAVVAGRYSSFIARATGQMREYSADEAEQAALSLQSLLNAAGAQVGVPGAEQIWAAVTARPLSVRGASGNMLLEPFMAEWGKADTGAVVSAIRQGYFEGQTNQEILNRIRGTRALRYQDGLLDVSRRHAEAVVRTAIQHIATSARNEVYAANEDIVEGYQWVATLDSRTTPICKSLDGQTFEVGKGPLPPAHVNCRSTTIPVLRGALAQLSEGGTRASQDGYVDKDLTYYEWLKRQDADFQDVALGPTRGQLFRNGGLSSEEFARLNLSKSFEPLTLEEMRALNPKAFRRAGI